MELIAYSSAKRRELLGRILLSGVILIFLFISAPAGQAQSLANTDLTTINVDDFSDEQLLNYVRQAENSGYSQSQLEAFARQRGMPESEIVKLRRRVEQLGVTTGNNSELGQGQTITGRTMPLQTEGEIFGRLVQPENFQALTEDEEKVFGFSLFRSENLNFTPNLNIPTPKNYVLGPGDEIVVDLWGATQQYWSLKVSPEGSVRPEDLSPVYVNGLTIESAEKKIINRLTQVYGGLKTSNDQEPTIFYQVSLGNIRTINVTIVGEVNSPGNYALNSLSSVFTALHAAGGPKQDGTFRSIKLMRDNTLKAEIDLYDFLVDGIRPNDELLRDGDVIIVKLYDAKVEVDGEVKRPGIYEFKEGEKFSDLLKYTGGFGSEAFKSFVTVLRNGNSGRQILNVAIEDFDNVELHDGDNVFIRTIDDQYNNRVLIEGAVFLEGDYELTEGLTVRQLIKKANGPKGDAYMTRATVYRMRDDYSQETIPFDLGRVLSGADEDILLQREDRVKISSVYDLNEEFYVEIIGEVARSGVYNFFERMTVEDLIILAGGLAQGASGAKVEISRRNKEGAEDRLSEIITMDIDESLNLANGSGIFIQPFDQIYIRRTQNYNIQQQVKVEGEVLSPGIYSLSRKDERISDIITRAQGLTKYAYPEGAIFIRKTEFADKVTDSEVNLEKLDELRKKIEADTSDNFNLARRELFERLGEIEEDIKRRKAQKEEAVGLRVTKELTQEIVSSDSISADEELPDEEPTILDLNEILSNPGSKYDFIMREGDVISIPPKLETVRVAGEVISPLNVRFDPSMTFKDYINESGGFTSKAKKGRSYVQYPNGRRRQTRRFLFFKFFPKLEPGSTIFVSRKPERAGVNLQSIIAATGSVATLALVIDRLSN